MSESSPQLHNINHLSLSRIDRAMGDNGQALLPKSKNKAFMQCDSHALDELHTFRTCLQWMCVDQSSLWPACLLWFVFLLFDIAVPCLSHFILACFDCDAKHQRPYDSVVQLSLSSIAVLSFVCLSRFVRKYGLRRLLFFDKLRDESETVRIGYTNQLNILMRDKEE